MSKPQAKPSFLSLLLPYIVLFLAFQLVWMSCQKPPDSRDSTQIFTAIKDDAAKLAVSNLSSLEAAYNEKLKEEQKAGKLAPAAAESKRLEAVLVVTDAIMQHGNLGEMQTAYMTMEKEARAKATDPLWSSLSVTSADGKRTLTGATLEENLRLAVSEKNKHELVYGVLPGYAVIDALVAATGRQPALSYWLAALMLALARNVPQAHGALVNGKWERSKWEGVELYEKTLGVLGLGHASEVLLDHRLGIVRVRDVHLHVDLFEKQLIGHCRDAEARE